MADKEKPDLSPQQRAEALMPGLSEDTFKIGDQSFQLRQLPIYYERRLVRLIGAEWDRLEDGTPLSTFADLIMEKLPEVVGVICYEQNALGADREKEWDEQKFREIVHWVNLSAKTMDLWKIVKAQVRKNELGDLVDSFLAQGKVKLGVSLSTPSS